MTTLNLIAVLMIAISLAAGAVGALVTIAVIRATEARCERSAQRHVDRVLADIEKRWPA